MGERHLPDSLTITCLIEDLPLQRAWVQVTLVSLRKNSFHLLFGPADESGRVSVTRPDLLREGEKEADLFPMDYGHPEGDWSGRIVIDPLNRFDVSRALRGYEQWVSSGVRYAPDYATGLRAFDEALSRHEGDSLRVQAEVSPPSSAEVVLRDKAV